jgi:ribosome biogenesis GTPase A
MQTKFPVQRCIFASYNKKTDIRELNQHLVDVAKRYPHSLEMNVLVVGMPNVGKSTLLNTLRNIGIEGPTPKALRTSANPGHTRALSTRLKLCQEPLIYAYDSPGVMLPFLGRGQEGAERGIKLALIAGIKEGLYDMEALASYILYKLNLLNPVAPAYLELLPSGSKPTSDLTEFLELVAQRMGMIRRGAMPDLERAAVHVVRWWREEGSLRMSSSLTNSSDHLDHSQQVNAWGFDFEWPSRSSPVLKLASTTAPTHGNQASWVQNNMEQCIDRYLESMALEDESDNNLSTTQERKMALVERKKRSADKRIQKYGQKRPR